MNDSIQPLLRASIGWKLGAKTPGILLATARTAIFAIFHLQPKLVFVLKSIRVQGLQRFIRPLTGLFTEVSDGQIA